MAPFSGKSIVLFEDVPVTKTAKRLLRIINPSEDDIEVTGNILKHTICIFSSMLRLCLVFLNVILKLALYPVIHVV